MDNTMAKIDNTHIELLTEENFSSWFVDVRARLRTKKLWKFKKRCTGCGKDGHTIDECWEENHDIAPDWLKEKRAKKEKEKEEDPPFKTIPKEKKKVVSHVF